GGQGPGPLVRRRARSCARRTRQEACRADVERPRRTSRSARSRRADGGGGVAQVKHFLSVLLRVGRSDDEWASLLGDLEEERRSRLARGSGRFAVFVWSAAEILLAIVWGLRDSLRPSGYSGQPSH